MSLTYLFHHQSQYPNDTKNESIVVIGYFILDKVGKETNEMDIHIHIPSTP